MRGGVLGSLWEWPGHSPTPTAWRDYRRSALPLTDLQPAPVSCSCRGFRLCSYLPCLRCLLLRNRGRSAGEGRKPGLPSIRGICGFKIVWLRVASVSDARTACSCLHVALLHNLQFFDTLQIRILICKSQILTFSERYHEGKALYLLFFKSPIICPGQCVCISHRAGCGSPRCCRSAEYRNLCWTLGNITQQFSGI